MNLSETENVHTAEIVLEPSVDKTGVLAVWCKGDGVSFDRQTAAEFLPILQHFIKTGEMLK